MTPDRDSRRTLWRLHTKTLSEHGTPVLFVEGRLGHHSAEELRRAIGAHASNGESALVIDLSAVDYVSSAALQVLRSAADHQSQHGGRLCLRAPSVAARFALEMSGLIALVDEHY